MGARAEKVGPAPIRKNIEERSGTRLDYAGRYTARGAAVGNVQRGTYSAGRCATTTGALSRWSSRIGSNSAATTHEGLARAMRWSLFHYVRVRAAESARCRRS